MSVKDDRSVGDECPKCGGFSYRGGYCFSCGALRPPGKKADTTEVENLDAIDFMTRSYGTRLSDLSILEEEVDERQKERQMRYDYSPARKKPAVKSVIRIADEPHVASLLLQAVVQPIQATSEGQLIEALVIPWRTIVERLTQDWSNAFQIPPRTWEEIIAGAFDQEGYDEVTLTPRSGDYGRDVIAVKRGIGCIRIIDSVKAYAPNHLVKHDDVRALAGVLLGEQNATKGILTTTSDFVPGIATDPFLKPLMPFRLELMNGSQLASWLSKLTS